MGTPANYVLRMTRAEAVMVRDALDIINPDYAAGISLRDKLLADAERLIGPKRREAERIIVLVEGGCVQDVQGIPSGAVVEVHDYDCDTELDGDRIRKDAKGRPYFRGSWVKE